MELKTVLETTDPMEAQLIKSRLDAAGIQCVIDNETNPLAGAMTTRIKVRVEDEDMAKDLIEEDATEDS